MTRSARTGWKGVKTIANVVGSEAARPPTGSLKRTVQEAGRVQLFKAVAVLDMCRLACASKFEGFDPDRMVDALQVVSDLIVGVVETLESSVEDAS